jgi:hypothetical protein
MARAIHRVMPPIEIIKGSEYNVDPEGSLNNADQFLREELIASGKTLMSMEKEIVTCPFIQIPGYLLLGYSVISVSFIICMLTLTHMPLAGLHFCVGLDFVTPSL